MSDLINYEKLTFPKIMFHGTTQEWVNMHLGFFQKDYVAKFGHFFDTTSNYEAALTYPKTVEKNWTHSIMIIDMELAKKHIYDIVHASEPYQIRFKTIPEKAYKLITASDLGLPKGVRITSSQIKSKLKQILKNN